MSKKSKYAEKVEARRRFAAKLGVSPAPYPVLWATEIVQKQGETEEQEPAETEQEPTE